jgi:hypothetical protein
MANPTTNYGFVLPTSTDLVTDLPADFDVALQGVDTRLKALQPGTTLGDLAYSSATANTNTRLGIGSTGNVLTVSGGVPVWSAPAAGGTTVKVVSGSTTTNYTNSTQTYSNTFTLAITPTAATSKIAAFGFMTTSVVTSSSAYGVARLFNTTTSTAGPVNETSQGTASGQWEFPRSFVWLDSPNSTSAQTYTIQIAKGSSGSGDISTSGNSIFIMLMEIGA